MSFELEPGLHLSRDVTVTAEMSPPHLAPTVVLSTPKMIELMEMASTDAVQGRLGESRTSVGTHVNVSHESAAREGEVVTVSAHLASKHIPDLIAHTARDIHPPGYYLLLHLWTRLFGPGVGSVRLLSVLIGTATVPLLYLAGKRLPDRRGPLLYLAGKRLLGRSGALLVAVALLALSPFHIYYSQEVRMYGLVTLLGGRIAVTSGGQLAGRGRSGRRRPGFGFSRSSPALSAAARGRPRGRER